MTSFGDLIQQGAGNAWLFMPGAILLGAMHGLEPGHSKTMMAAFIVAIRGTVSQAVMLGLSSTLSHTAVVWLVTLAGLRFGRNRDIGADEPYFQLASAVLVIFVALWLLARTRREHASEKEAEAAHLQNHRHDDEHHNHHHDDSGLDRVSLDLGLGGYQDAHERAHAAYIARRFQARNATNRQIIVFGLTGGLIPCPAAITVLLICLQLKRMTLGITLVVCFSVGLALTMVASGAIAALGVRHAGKRWPEFGRLARRAPYVSSLLIACIGLYMGYRGLLTLNAL